MRAGFATACSALAFAATASGSFVTQPMRSRTQTATSASAVRAASATMAGTVVVTDGTDSFYGSRAVFQTLFDYGDYDKITAFSSSTSNAKKMCISRQARYSGLIDVLDFAEGGDAELQGVLSDAAAWVVMNGDAATLPAQFTAAQSAGVSRVFVHLCAESSDALPDTAALATAAGSLDYSFLVTGKLGKDGAGGGLQMGEASEATCAEVSMDDTHRVIVEALTIPEASKRAMTLRPSKDDSQLKSMRMAGCTRREEVEALVKGKISERTAEEIAADAGKPAQKKAEEEEELDPRSEEEKRLAREEEVKALLNRAKERGIETQKRMAAEEEEKKKLRAERMAQAAYFAPPEEDDKKKDDNDDAGDDEPEPPPPPPDNRPGENPPGGTATLERPPDDPKKD